MSHAFTKTAGRAIAVGLLTSTALVGIGTAAQASPTHQSTAASSAATSLQLNITNTTEHSLRLQTDLGQAKTISPHGSAQFTAPNIEGVDFTIYNGSTAQTSAFAVGFDAATDDSQAVKLKMGSDVDVPSGRSGYYNYFDQNGWQSARITNSGVANNHVQQVNMSVIDL